MSRRSRRVLGLEPDITCDMNTMSGGQGGQKVVAQLRLDPVTQPLIQDLQNRI